MLKRYNTIPDSSVVVSDSEIKAYYNKHKSEKQYNQLASRGVKYISFDVEPSESDLSFLKNEVDLILPEFENTDNDSLFVINNSENRQSYNISYRAGTYRGDEDS